MRVTTRVARATLIQIVSRVLGAAIGLLVLGLASRNLHGEGLGYYATVLAYVGFLAVLADLGLGQLAARELTVGAGAPPARLGNLLGLRLAASVLIFVSGAIGAQFLPLDDAVRSGIWTGIVAFALASVTQIFVVLYQIRISIGLVAAAELTGRLVLLGVVAACFRQGWGLQGFLVGHVAANGATLAILAYAARNSSRVRPRADRGEWRRLLGESWPIALSLAMLFVYTRADILVLSALAPAQTVGLYAAAYKIVEVVVQIPVMFVGFVAPLLAFASDKPERVGALFQRAFDALSLFAIGVMVGGLILAEPIVRFVSGDAFTPAAGVFRVLVVATGMLSLSLLPSAAVVAVRKQRAMLPVYILMAVLGLGLYLSLIPALSALGAALGTMVTESVFAVAGYTLVLRWLKIGLRFGILARGLVAAVILGLALLATPHWHLLPRMAAGVTAYVVALILLGALPWSLIAGVLGSPSRRQEPE